MIKEYPAKLNLFYLIPVFNCEKTIKRCLNSIYSYDHDINIVIIDDNSNDNSLQVIKEFSISSKYKFFILSNLENFGISYSLNKGIEVAIKNGADYILRLDGDDFNTKSRTDIQIDYMQKHKDVMLLTSSAYLIRDNIIKKPQIFSFISPLEQYFRPYIPLVGSIDFHPTFCFRSSVFLNFNIRYGYIPDKIKLADKFPFFRSGAEDLLIINLIIYFYGYRSVVILSKQYLIYYSISQNSLTTSDPTKRRELIDKITMSSMILYLNKYDKITNINSLLKLSFAISSFHNKDCNYLKIYFSAIISFFLILNNSKYILLRLISTCFLPIVSIRLFIESIKTNILSE